MSSTASWRTSASVAFSLLAGCATTSTLLFQDDFNSVTSGSGQWIVEAEQAAKIIAASGALDIDTPAGVTVWFRPRLEGPVRIEFDATAVAQGGHNDQVSDLNVFWMASNADGSAPFSTPRSGGFGEYNDLRTYYVGLGGNRNTTTRFRRYSGDPQYRPLLPEHDLSGDDILLKPNRQQSITLLADGRIIEYRRDGKILFRFEDHAPYVAGWFGFRTTFSHLRIERLRIFALRQH